MFLKMELLLFNQMLVGQSQAIVVNKISQSQMQDMWGHWQNLQVLYDAPRDLNAKSKSWKTQRKSWLYCNFKALKEYLLSSSSMWDSQLLNSFRVKRLGLYPQGISCIDHTPRNLLSRSHAKESLCIDSCCRPCENVRATIFVKIHKDQPCNSLMIINYPTPSIKVCYTKATHSTPWDWSINSTKSTLPAFNY